METKYFAIIVLGFMLISGTGMILDEYNKNNKSIEMAKSGLEECPKEPNSMSSQTIWVKSCKEYLETININKK